jgi:hypothetical protein
VTNVQRDYAPDRRSLDASLAVAQGLGDAERNADLGWAYSLGHNFDSDGSFDLTDPTDLSNVAPLLGPLQDNGGPTPTHALQLGSPAIDAIPTASCTYDHDGDPGTSEVALGASAQFLSRTCHALCTRSWSPRSQVIAL